MNCDVILGEDQSVKNWRVKKEGDQPIWQLLEKLLNIVLQLLDTVQVVVQKKCNHLNFWVVVKISATVK
jgi:hypothetical protein